MSKPKKLTTGHSSGPQAYWDSVSDAKKDADRANILAILEDLYLNVLEDVPDNHYTKHLQCSLEDAKEVLIEAGVLKDE